MQAGRNCPLDYRLPADSFAREPLFDCQTLYVVGGLYGNRQALHALEKRLAAEPDARAVFNGDAHWFDLDADVFADIEARLAAHTVLRGNVETELGRPGNDDAGCGCAYPDSVDDQTVARSNQIHARLSGTVAQLPGMAAQLADRPATALVSVAGRRIAITHGDEESLAGWHCARTALATAARQQALQDWMAAHALSVLATSHTCAAAALCKPDFAVINNGAAGMPNFNNGRYGLVTRISTQPHPSALYRAELDGLVIEAVPLSYNHAQFIDEFDRQWAADSPAALSYRERVMRGGEDAPQAALLGGFELGQTLCAMGAID
ncbi:hypothetical protein [Halopseudomonas laoshanensis]|uniref:hypothetical protein n=1 Tax=Halopseudomonas laoshanensis TaxID=2268758 RepID=UPI003735E031